MNAQLLLDALMRAGPTPSTQTRVGHALGPGGLGGTDNPLGGMLGGLLQEAGSMLSAGRERVASGDPVAIGGLGALAGLLLGGRGGALGGGALALLGSLAISALQKAGQAPTATSAPPVAAPAGEETAKLIVRAMVSAAKADGAIDGAEMDRLMSKVKEAGAEAEAERFLLGELQKPLDLDGLIRSVSSEEEAVEVYAASLLAIEVDTPAEVDYLRRLAAGLGLSPQTLSAIHETLGVNPV